MKKFFDSDWLKAVQFFLNKVQKYLTKYKLQKKKKRKIENITLP